MVQVDLVEAGGKKLIGLKVQLPHAPLLLLIHEDVLIGCGYFDIAVLEKTGDKACKVSGVENFEQVLKAKIRDYTSEVGKLGAEKGLIVEKFIEGL